MGPKVRRERCGGTGSLVEVLGAGCSDDESVICAVLEAAGAASISWVEDGALDTASGAAPDVPDNKALLDCRGGKLCAGAISSKTPDCLVWLGRRAILGFRHSEFGLARRLTGA